MLAKAREQHLPVLLFVKASWCRWCRELEETVFADPEVASLLEHRHLVQCRLHVDCAGRRVEILS